MQSSRNKVDIVSDLIVQSKISDDRYEIILDKFIDNRGIIKNGNRKPKQVQIKQQNGLNLKRFGRPLINKRAKIVYQDIQEDAIIEEVAKTFNQEAIPKVTIQRFTQRYNAKDDKIEHDQETTVDEVDFFRSQKLTDFLSHFIKDEKLSLHFIVKLLNKIDRQKIINNPKKAKARLLSILKDTIYRTILSEVSYQFLDTRIYLNDL